MIIVSKKGLIKVTGKGSKRYNVDAVRIEDLELLANCMLNLSSGKRTRKGL